MPIALLHGYILPALQPLYRFINYGLFQCREHTRTVGLYWSVRNSVVRISLLQIYTDVRNNGLHNSHNKRTGGLGNIFQLYQSATSDCYYPHFRSDRTDGPRTNMNSVKRTIRTTDFVRSVKFRTNGPRTP